MPASPTELLHEWHDFFLLVGTASATLVGLLFVAASIGSSIFNEEHRAPLKAFITPTVVHFAAALVTCLLAIMPTHDWRTLGCLLGAEGIAGSIYGGGILVQIIVRRVYNVDLIDRLLAVREGISVARGGPTWARAAEGAHQGRRLAALDAQDGGTLQGRRPWMADPHGQGAEESGGVVGCEQ